MSPLNEICDPLGLDPEHIYTLQINFAAGSGTYWVTGLKYDESALGTSGYVIDRAGQSRIVTHFGFECDLQVAAALAQRVAS